MLIVCLLLGLLKCATPAPAIEEMPILVTWYNPALCYEGLTINCDSDPSVLADGQGWEVADYGRVAACIPQWLGRTIRFKNRELKCRDAGGMILPRWDDYHRAWVIPVDVLSQTAVTDNYWLYAEWALR